MRHLELHLLNIHKCQQRRRFSAATRRVPHRSHASRASPHTAPTEFQESALTTTSVRNKPPPIHACNITLKDTITLLSVLLNKSEFSVKQSDPNNYTIFTSDISAFEKAKKCLSDNKKEYYSYTPKSKKLKNVILKGINGDFTADDIMKDITELKLPDVNITKIAKITFNKKNPSQFYFLVQLSNDSNLNELLKVNKIVYQKVRWENLKKREIYQCRNCQRLGHSSANCSLAFRCVKCKESHEPGKCQTPKETTDKKLLYCINFESNGHPTSYRGCPFFKFSNSIRNNIRSHKTINNDKKIANINNRLNPTSLSQPSQPPFAAKSYSNVLSNNSTQNTGNNYSSNNYDPNLISILNDFKNQILHSINSQLNFLHIKVAENASKIQNLHEIFQLSDNNG